MIIRQYQSLKIKLKAIGYHLVYEVIDEVLVVYVIAVGKREHNLAHQAIAKRTVGEQNGVDNQGKDGQNNDNVKTVKE
ncbi:type II toxin-antitoxin system RelE/ParE family toxin [Moraxella sp. VT-16-12]|uniref:type II toxin-antitoxin system RelE family toxin n=1 Tax=Moraxella sp. VT-16-12 TaxID=2014877 RepID=UPI00351B11B8